VHDDGSRLNRLLRLSDICDGFAGRFDKRNGDLPKRTCVLARHTDVEELPTRNAVLQTGTAPTLILETRVGWTPLRRARGRNRKSVWAGTIANWPGAYRMIIIIVCIYIYTRYGTATMGEDEWTKTGRGRSGSTEINTTSKTDDRLVVE